MLIFDIVVIIIIFLVKNAILESHSQEFYERERELRAWQNNNKAIDIQTLEPEMLQIGQKASLNDPPTYSSKDIRDTDCEIKEENRRCLAWMEESKRIQQQKADLEWQEEVEKREKEEKEREERERQELFEQIDDWFVYDLPEWFD